MTNKDFFKRVGCLLVAILFGLAFFPALYIAMLLF